MIKFKTNTWKWLARCLKGPQKNFFSRRLGFQHSIFGIWKVNLICRFITIEIWWNCRLSYPTNGFWPTLDFNGEEIHGTGKKDNDGWYSLHRWLKNKKKLIRRESQKNWINNASKNPLWLHTWNIREISQMAYIGLTTSKWGSEYFLMPMSFWQEIRQVKMTMTKNARIVKLKKIWNILSLIVNYYKNVRDRHSIHMCMDDFFEKRNMDMDFKERRN